MREFRYRNPSKPTSTYSDTPSAPSASIRQVVGHSPPPASAFALDWSRVEVLLTPASPRVYFGVTAPVVRRQFTRLVGEQASHSARIVRKRQDAGNSSEHQRDTARCAPTPRERWDLNLQELIPNRHGSKMETAMFASIFVLLLAKEAR